MIMNLGNFGLSSTIDFNPCYIAFKHYYQKGFYRLFNINNFEYFSKDRPTFLSQMRIN